MKVLFLDESGNHKLKKIDQKYPIFVLGAVIVDRAYARDVIDKPALVARHGVRAEDPYMYSLHILVERFCKELGNELDAGFICAEKRGGSLDRDLLLAWEKLRTRGSRYASAKHIDCRIVSLDLRDKKPNLAGMQLADLVITPVGRHVLGVPPRPNRIHWEVVEHKMRRVGKTYVGAGLVQRP